MIRNEHADPALLALPVLGQFMSLLDMSTSEGNIFGFVLKDQALMLRPASRHFDKLQILLVLVWEFSTKGKGSCACRC